MRSAELLLRKFLLTVREGTPYLISLGLSKSAVAMVFLAGPISGLIVQPLIGAFPPSCKGIYRRFFQVYLPTTQNHALVAGDRIC